MIFLHSPPPILGGGKDPHSWKMTPPNCFLFFNVFLMFLMIINLCFAHIYTTPLSFSYTPTLPPPNFKFLEITLIIIKFTYTPKSSGLYNLGARISRPIKARTR